MERLVSKEKLEMAKLLVEKNGADIVEDSVLKNLKLGKLEDIEEELGIDLITYFKIKSAKRIVVKELGNDTNEMLVRNSKDCIDVCYESFEDIPECDSTLYLIDYGKFWALTKEELL